MRRRSGEVTRAILECFHAHPTANAVEIGGLCQVAKSYVCSVLRAHGLTTLTRRPPPPADEQERRARRNQWEARRRERINSHPETREAALAARRIYEQRRKALASPEEIEKERERCRLKSRKSRAAAKTAKLAALELAAKLPEARIRTEAEIFADYQARKTRRQQQRRGENFARNQYLQQWHEKVSRV